MITINLLPEELKAKATKTSFEIKYFLLLIPLVSALLVLLHFAFAVNGLMKNSELNGLNNQWKQLQPQLKLLQGTKDEDVASLADKQLLQQLTAQRINWAEKLNKLSSYLTNGLWFNSMSITSIDLVLRGTIFSLQKEEMSLINKFMTALKKDKGFFDDFSNFELSSVQKNMRGGYETIDLVLTGLLKTVKQKVK